MADGSPIGGNAFRTQIPGQLTLPGWIEAEQQVLGACLEDPAIIGKVQVKGGKTLFRADEHRRLFEIMAQRDREGSLVSIVTLANIGEVEDLLADMGGRAYLAKLLGATISRHAAEAYCDMLAENNRKAALQRVLEQASADLQAGLLTATDVALKLESQAGAIDPGPQREGDKPRSFMRAMIDTTEAMVDAINGEEPPGIPTGIPEVDRILNPMGPGQLLILGGRPSMGKTALAVSIAMRAAKRGHPVGFVSLEMPDTAIVQRAISEETAGKPGGGATPYANMARGDLTEAQLQAYKAAGQALEHTPMWFMGARYNDPAAIYAGMRQILRGPAATMEKMPLLVVDYLQLLTAKGQNRTEQVTAISQGLKRVAMQLECPVIALAQLSRNVEQRDDKRPQLADLRESGQIEQDADGILFAYREEYYVERAKPPEDALDKMAMWQGLMEKLHNRASLIIAKQRGGRIGTADFRFNPALNLVWSDKEWLL